MSPRLIRMHRRRSRHHQRMRRDLTADKGMLPRIRPGMRRMVTLRRHHQLREHLRVHKQQRRTARECNS
jgi:hypothetical protein